MKDTELKLSEFEQNIINEFQKTIRYYQDRAEQLSQQGDEERAKEERATAKWYERQMKAKLYRIRKKAKQNENI